MRDKIPYSLDVILLVVLTTLCMRACRAEAGDGRPDALPACKAALSACEELSAQQDAQVLQLKQVVKQYQAEARPPSTGLSLAAGVLVGGVSGAVGGAVAGDKTGAIVGGATGAAVGAILSTLLHN